MFPAKKRVARRGFEKIVDRFRRGPPLFRVIVQASSVNTPELKMPPLIALPPLLPTPLLSIVQSVSSIFPVL